MRLSRDTGRWLLEGDVAVVWQTQRDLLGRAASTWQAARRRVSSEGWAARLLARRAEDGTWGGGLYGPKWTSTFYTLQLLTQLGVPPDNRAAVESCLLLVDRGVTEAGGVSLWTSPYTDTCVTGMLLSMACYFGLFSDERVPRMTTWLLQEQMRDGGWNCERAGGATHASFHTTISVLEGLTAFEAGATTLKGATKRAAKAGREFFLRHQLYRSCRTARIVRASFSRLSFPARWFFDILRGLEHFASVRAAWDPRLDDAVTVLSNRARGDGRWPVQNRHTGKVFFELEKAGRPSRMNTLRALRVLQWVEGARPRPFAR